MHSFGNHLHSAIIYIERIVARSIAATTTTAKEADHQLTSNYIKKRSLIKKHLSIEPLIKVNYFIKRFILLELSRLL